MLKNPNNLNHTNHHRRRKIEDPDYAYLVNISHVRVERSCFHFGFVRIGSTTTTQCTVLFSKVQMFGAILPNGQTNINCLTMLICDS
jgi:hypothetical protein